MEGPWLLARRLGSYPRRGDGRIHQAAPATRRAPPVRSVSPLSMPAVATSSPPRSRNATRPPGRWSRDRRRGSPPSAAGPARRRRSRLPRGTVRALFRRGSSRGAGVARVDRTSPAALSRRRQPRPSTRCRRRARCAARLRVRPPARIRCPAGRRARSRGRGGPVAHRQLDPVTQRGAEGVATVCAAANESVPFTDADFHQAQGLPRGGSA